MKPITLTFLKSLGACQGQVDLFAQTYGESVTPTLAACEAVAQLFDFGWLGKEVFGQTYEDAKAPHERAYQEAVAPLWKAYQEAKAPLWKAYEEAVTPLAQALKLAQATTFYHLWSQQ